MFLDAFYKHLQGFFDLALMNCSSDQLPQWVLVRSGWPISGIIVAYIIIAGWVLPSKNRGNNNRSACPNMKMLNIFYGIMILCSFYINFNTLVVINKESKAGSKLVIATECNICSCFLVMWFHVIVQIFSVYGDLWLTNSMGQNVNCVLVAYNALKMLNAWIGFQFYQRESAIMFNLVTLGDAVSYSFAWGHRRNNIICRSINPTPEVRVLTAAQCLICCTVVGALIILTQDLDQRYLWWTLEINLFNMFLMGLLCGWREFKLCLTFIVVGILEFLVIGIYVALNRDPEIAEGTKKVIQEITKARMERGPDSMPIATALNTTQGGEVDVIGPVQQ